MSASKEMDSEQKGDQRSPSTPSGFSEMVLERYRKIKDHAETYPYVWASYIVVYGGFGLWFTYRWRKLRKTEDRVRVLQQRLRELVENEEHASSASSSRNTPPPAPSVKETPPPTVSFEKAPSSDKAPK